MEGRQRFSDKGSEEQKPFPFWQLPQPLPFDVWITDEIVAASRESEEELTVEGMVEYLNIEYRGLKLDRRQIAVLKQKLDAFYNRDLYPYDLDF